jgi:hypothetical protein
MKVINLFKTALALSLGISLGLSACITTREKPEEFIVDLDSSKIEIGEIEAQFDRLFSIGGLKKVAVAVSYFPAEDAVCLKYKSDLMTYYQFWSRTGREAYINSLERYNEDYTERNLDRKERRTKQKYGVVQGYLIWQLHRFAVKARGNMNVELGYAFNERSPYFTVNQREALYKDPIQESENRESLIITMFFTRAQAEELTALFNQEFLDGLASPDSGRTLTPGIDRDEY